MSKSRNKSLKKASREQMPHFAFDNVPYQDTEESIGEPFEYELGNAELELGENRHRTHHRTLRDEDGAGHEP